MSRLDAVRAEHPALGFAVYAIEPDAPMVLEVHEDGNVWSWSGETLDELLDLAFPLEAPIEAPPEPAASVFD